ncbi:unnamed protein product [Dovyalis caffra]|uniref:Uncharacterized protein n=1 Tax=Dovyalis caffra TaxID=77055 RepID=A0AAV1RD98_9ROSI|nr:unnamed protein product [Dovyalis caffra]
MQRVQEFSGKLKRYPGVFTNTMSRARPTTYENLRHGTKKVMQLIVRPVNYDEGQRQAKATSGLNLPLK